MKAHLTYCNTALRRNKIIEHLPTHTRFLMATLVGLACALVNTARAALPGHNVAAADLTVVQNDQGNTAASVTVTASNVIGDFRVRDGSNRGDFNVQIGDDPTDDMTSGILISSVTQNGRDNGETGATLGTIYAPSFIQPQAAGYFISVNIAGTNGAGNNPEWNVNVAGAWFPYTNWLGGYAFPASGANGSATVTNDTLIGSPQLVYGTHYIDKASGGGANAGKSIVDLTSLGIDSRADGVLLVNGAKNESANYGLSMVNSNNGTWNLFIRDTGNTGANGEQDPIAFVFVPKSNTNVVSGRFRGDASIAMFSGTSAQFTVTQLGTGRYELKIPGHPPSSGVLIISAEGGGAINFDNIVSYEVNAAGDGWEIQSRDTPAVFNGTGIVPPLESPGAGEAVCSFVFLPGPTPGITATPRTGLLTTESGGQATFNVALDTQPTDVVTFGISSSNPNEGVVSTNSLSFDPTNWNIPQTVTVTGVDDAVVDGSVAYTIILSPAVSTDTNYNGFDPIDVAVVNADNESGITVTPTSGLTTTEAAGTATFTIVLNTPPSSTVTIGLSSSDTTEGTVSPASVIFDNNNWNVPQTVTVTGVDDFVVDGTIGYTIVTAAAASADPSYNGLNAADVSVVNIDNDSAGLVFSFNALNGLALVEGASTNVTVALQSQPTQNVTITFTSSDTVQGGSVSPVSRTFTAGNWNTPQSITVMAADDLALDGNTGWFVTNSISSSDGAYAALPAVTFPVITFDNEAVLALPSGDLIYGIGQPGLGIDGRAVLTDTNTASYNGSTLTITLTANGTADDRLEIRNSGTGPGQIGVSGNNVTYGGTTVATFAGGTGTTPLVITFNAASTPDAAQATLRNVTFRNVNSSPSLNRRSVSVTLSRTGGYAVNATGGVRVGLLRVTEFQEGADHGYGPYTGEADVEILQSSPNTSFPSGGGAGLTIDWPDAGGINQAEVLMRYDNILGNAFGQIPTNAILVYAELILYVPPDIANTQGDGSPLYRMLIPFDATNETWTSIGNGIDADGIEARTEFDSQIGVSGAAGDSGVGFLHAGVTADIQAWANGEVNNGWGMPGWPGGTDALSFSPSEAASIDFRPRLRIMWLPAGTASASFRQNVNGYASAHDTRIRANTPDADGSALANAFVDWDVAGTGVENDDQILIRFDDIFGSNPGQVPPGSQIHAAMLDLATVINNGYGDGGQFYAILAQWQDTDTWNTLLNGISADGFEAASNATAVAGSPTRNPNVCGGFMAFDMTTDVAAWSSGARPNYGWAILPWPNGGDGWGVSLSESVTERERPQLRIYYTPGAPSIVIRSISRSGASATIQFTGTAGNTYTILRSGTVNGTYTSVGTATAQPDGSASFTDGSSPSGQAFYRISYP